MKKLPFEQWYEIEEYIPPGDSLANVPYWSPVHVGTEARSRVYREPSRKAALSMLKSAKKGTRFRLVLVTREVLKVKE